MTPPLLLASVSDAAEAAAAIDAGADIVDLKDPARGVLGACDLRVLALVAALRDRRAPRRPLSAALGPAHAASATGLAAAAARLGYDHLKTGLDGIRDPAAAAASLRRLRHAAHRAAAGVRLIAATYADAGAAAALDPAELPAAAAAAGFDGCLLDTAVKDGRGLLDHLGAAGLARFVRACRSHGLLVAVAGGAAPGDLPDLVATAPDIIGARGALCTGGRLGRLDPGRVVSFRAAIAAAFAAAPGPASAAAPGPGSTA